MSTRQDKLEDTVRSVFVNRSPTCLHRQLMDEVIKGLSSSILFMYTLFNILLLCFRRVFKKNH